MNTTNPGAPVSTQPLSVGAATDKHKLRLAQYIAGAFFFWASLYLYVPTLPLYAHSKTSGLVLVGLAISMYGLIQALVRLPLGIAADWAGRRKPFLLCGYLFCALGAWWMGRAGGIQGIILGRAITGLGAAMWLLLIVGYSSLFPPAQAARAAALLTLVNTIGLILATSLTGWLNGMGGYPLPFNLSSAIALIGFLVMLPGREVRVRGENPTWCGVLNLTTRRDVLLPSLLNAALQYAIYSSTFGFIPILAGKMGASGWALGALVTLNLAMAAAGNLLSASLVRRTGERALVFAGFASMAVGLGMAAMAPSMVWIFLGQGLAGLAGGVCYPVLMGMSIARVEERERGTAMGLHQAVYAVGMFAGPWLSGMLAEQVGIQPMFAAYGVLLAAGIAVSIFLNTRRKLDNI